MNTVQATFDLIKVLTTNPSVAENVISLLFNQKLFTFEENQFIPMEQAKQLTPKEKTTLNIKKEIEKMPEQLKHLLTIDDHLITYRKRPNGSFEARWRKKGLEVTATAKDLTTLKRRFIAKLTLRLTEQAEGKNTRKPTLSEYLLNWLETVKKNKIKAVTYNDYVNTVKTYVAPSALNKRLDTIIREDCQRFFNDLTDQGKNRTAQKLSQLLTAVFRYALEDDVIRKNPMALVELPNYEKKSGTAFTVQEEAEFIKKILASNNHLHRAMILIILTGIRRSELADIEVDGNWIKVKTAKQRQGRSVKWRYIPITPQLKKYLPELDVESFKSISVDCLTRWVPIFAPTHHCHDLRHTFITRCKITCGIDNDVVMYWAGHEGTTLTDKVYTHPETSLSELYEVAQKVNY